MSSLPACLPACVQGDAVVMVEHRSGSSDAYGQGRKTPMTLRDLISHMQHGDSNLYLSTQEVGLICQGAAATAAAAAARCGSSCDRAGLLDTGHCNRYKLPPSSFAGVKYLVSRRVECNALVQQLGNALAPQTVIDSSITIKALALPFS